MRASASAADRPGAGAGGGGPGGGGGEPSPASTAEHRRAWHAPEALTPSTDSMTSPGMTPARSADAHQERIHSAASPSFPRCCPIIPGRLAALAAQGPALAATLSEGSLKRTCAAACSHVRHDVEALQPSGESLCGDMRGFLSLPPVILISSTSTPSHASSIHFCSTEGLANHGARALRQIRSCAEAR